MLRLLWPLTMFAMIGMAADDHVDREKLIGTWQSPEAEGETWILQTSGDNLHITRLQNNQKLMDFECNTAGRECAIKDSGRDTKVTMWYSGPKLVVMETKGSEVVKRRLDAAEGDTMQVEVISIVPDHKPELAKFVRRTETADKHQ